MLAGISSMKVQTRALSGWGALILLTTSAAAVAADGGLQRARPGWEAYVRPALDSGKAGVAWFAATGPESDAEILDPRGFTVHSTPPDHSSKELVRPAGEPFRLPLGTWRVWIEGEGRMSAASERLGVASSVPFSDSGGRGAGAHFMPVVPAGSVGLPSDLSAAPGNELWLLHSEPPPWQVTGYELSRRLPMAGARESVLMPEGRTLAGLWNEREKRYTALSREFQVIAGQTTPAPLEQPSPDRSWLIASVGGAHFSEPVSVLTLERPEEGAPRRPDLQFTTREGVHAVWYDLAPGIAVLTGGSAELYVERQVVDLRGGEIAHFAGTFIRRPLLEVGLVLPRLLREQPFDLAVRRLPDGEELVRVELPRTAGRHRFENGLVQAPLEVVLETPVGSFRERVDLTGELEGFVTVQPEVIRIYGTLRYGGEPREARIEFTSAGGEKSAAHADESGVYSLQTLQPLRLVEIQLAGVDREPWIDFFPRPLDVSQQLDFDLSDADITVRVLDAETRLPIAGARIGVRNEYLPSSEEEGVVLDEAEWRRRMRAIGQSHTTDDDGVARLPSPRPGRLRVRAGADGYRSLESPVEIVVPDPPLDREIEVLLEPHAGIVDIHLRLPDGVPAAGAEVLRVGGDGSGTVYSGAADEDGVVRVPVEPADGLLALRHPGAGLGFVDWREWQGRERVEWTFPPAAELPLSLRVTDPSGEAPAPAMLTLWIGGRRLDDHLFQWLLRRPPITDGQGLATIHGLPRVPVRVLAWAPHLREQAAAGALDSFAVEVGYPWPAQVELRVVP